MFEDAIEPWEDVQTLAEIGRLLYPGGDDEAAKQSGCLHAVSVIRSWQRRCSTLPHAIISTALLVEASIYQRTHKDQPEQQSSIRNMYAIAFSRFVNGFTDNLPGTMAMDKMAELLKMPPRWADVRHAITHGHMPELRTLESAIGPALEWLWWGFWVRFCTEEGEGREEPRGEEERDEKEFTEKLISLLRDYLKQCESRYEDEEFPSPIPLEEAEDFQRRIVNICGTDVKRWDVAASLLVDDGLMSPRSGTALSEEPIPVIWESLFMVRLQEEGVTTRGNLELKEARLVAATRLMLALHRKIRESAPANPEARAKAQKQQNASSDWLCLMFEQHSLWRPLINWHFRKRENESAFIESLLVESTHCCLKVANAFIDRGDEAFQDEWMPIYEAAAGMSHGGERTAISRTERMEGVERMDVELPDLMEESQAWEFLEKGEDKAVAQLEATQGGWKRDSSYWSNRRAKSDMWPGEEIDKVA